MKILIAGLGSAGQRHARNLRALLGAEAELVSYRNRGRKDVITQDLRIKEGTTLEEEFGLQILGSFEEALATGPDVALIATPNHFHTNLALRAAEAKCHLFIEKPVAHTLDGLDKLAALVREHRLVCLVAYQLRFHPGLELLLHLLEEKAVGEIISGRMIFGEYLPDWHRYEDYRGYHAARADQGGGVLLSQIHDIDFLYALFGMPKKICCFGGKLTDLEIDVEDTASILFEFERQGRCFPFHLHQDYVQKPPVRACEVIGTKARIFWDYFSQELRVIHHDGQVDTHSFRTLQRNDLFLGEMRHFLDCVQNGTRPRVTLEDGIDSLRIALAGREALRTGQVVAEFPGI